MAKRTLYVVQHGNKYYDFTVTATNYADARKIATSLHRMHPDEEIRILDFECPVKRDSLPRVTKTVYDGWNTMPKKPFEVYIQRDPFLDAVHYDCDLDTCISYAGCDGRSFVVKYYTRGSRYDINRYCVWDIDSGEVYGSEYVSLNWSEA